MMLRSDHDGAPEYAQVDVEQVGGSMHAHGGHQPPVDLLALRLGPGQSVELPEAERTLVIVTSGALRCAGVEATPGDELRLAAGDDPRLVADGGASALIWQLR
jgi:redox-sensitive bicupin YhaK (pirin superfamily)